MQAVRDSFFLSVDSLASVQFQEQSTKFSEMEERAVTAEQKLQEYKTSWEEQKKAKSLEAKKLEARYADLVNQNSMLHSQLEKVFDCVSV